MRQPRPWYRRFNDTWYVQVGKRQVPLARGQDNEAEAFRRYHELMSQQDITQAVDESRINVASVCDAFLVWSERHNAPKTFAWYRAHLQSFCDQSGRILVSALRPHHVERWLDSHETWGQSTRRGAIIAIKRVMNWAVDQGYLSTQPLRKLKRPPSVARTRLITDEEHAAMLNASDEPFRNLLTALRETGARPGEVAAVTAADVDFERRVWILRKHKTAYKTGKPRIIYLTESTAQLCRTLAEAHPKGPLFRNRLGQPWTTNSVRCRFRQIARKLDLEDGIFAYAYRHTFTTNGLAKGVPIATMAELLGHVDTTMISAHYSHLAQKTEHLRQAAEMVTQEDECA